MKTEIKKIDVGKVALVSGYLIFALVLIATIIVNITLFVMYQVVFKSFNFIDLVAGILGGLLTAVLLGAFNSAVFALLAWLYNLGSRFFGGLIFESQVVEQKKSSLFTDKPEQ